MDKFRPDTEEPVWVCVGRQAEVKAVSKQIDRFLKGKERRGVCVIAGGYGVGKTLMLKSIVSKVQRKINDGHYSVFKYGERNRIFYSGMNCVERGKKLNGLRSVLQSMFRLVAARHGRAPDRAFFEHLLKPDAYSTPHHPLGTCRVTTCSSSVCSSCVATMCLSTSRRVPRRLTSRMLHSSTSSSRS